MPCLNCANNSLAFSVCFFFHILPVCSNSVNDYFLQKKKKTVTAMHKITARSNPSVKYKQSEYTKLTAGIPLSIVFSQEGETKPNPESVASVFYRKLEQREYRKCTAKELAAIAPTTPHKKSQNVIP